MAMNKEKKLLELFDRLSERAKESTLDFMAYLANQHENERKDKWDKLLERANGNEGEALKAFYDSLPEDNEPLSEEELRQLADDEGYMTREEAKRAYDLDLP